jgi:hypothetical protein
VQELRSRAARRCHVLWRVRIQRHGAEAGRTAASGSGIRHRRHHAADAGRVHAAPGTACARAHARSADCRAHAHDGPGGCIARSHAGPAGATYSRPGGSGARSADAITRLATAGLSCSGDVPGPVAPAAAVPPERAYRRFEDTRVVHSGAVDTEASERFVLQFSTGEGTTVFGSGLIGRNPVVQPGESFDQIVTITDPGKSVSKTHLEFGQTDGTFWVSDRFSGNGTVVRQPDERPQRLHPGRRHPVARGSRIDIAEQFFIVS